MFVVIFEVHPKAQCVDKYLGLAGHLKPILESMDGFMDNERFESKRRERWILSLSTWRDEKSLIRWRTEGHHHEVQEKGRFAVFEDYMIRIGEVTGDSSPPTGFSVEEQRFDETEVGVGKAITITELVPAAGATTAAQPDALMIQLGLDANADGLADHDVFESIYNPGKVLLLAKWRDAKSAAAWTPRKPGGVDAVRHRHVRVIRDYGMFERREAPQYYAPVQKAGG